MSSVGAQMQSLRVSAQALNIRDTMIRTNCWIFYGQCRDCANSSISAVGFPLVVKRKIAQGYNGIKFRFHILPDGEWYLPVFYNLFLTCGFCTVLIRTCERVLKGNLLMRARPESLRAILCLPNCGSGL